MSQAIRLPRDQELKQRAARVIPNGMYGHQLSTILPPDTPQYFARAQGCRLWDVDGNEYIDFLSSYGPIVLGHHHAAVDEAARRQQAQGDCMTGPGEVMIELAERFVATVEHADWAMFAKNGTDATTMCLTIARATTGKGRILVANGAYHGADPWCTPSMEGVLPAERESQGHYDFNDIESLENAVAEAGDDLAAIVVSAYKHDVFVDNEYPTLEFARKARELCDRHGAALIIDEVRAGFRLNMGSTWELFGVNADLTAWSKAIANGYPIAAVLGGQKFIEGAMKIYATGSFWFSAVPMAAAIATIDALVAEGAIAHMTAMGQRLREGLAEQSQRHGFGLRQTGPVQMPQILFDDDAELKKGYFWCNEAIKGGVYLHPWHNMFVNAAHRAADIDRALEITEQAFRALREQAGSL